MTCSDIIKNLCRVRDELRDTRINGVVDIRGEDRPPVAPVDDEHPTGRKRAFGKQPPVESRKQRRTLEPEVGAIPDDMSSIGSPSTLNFESDADTASMHTDIEEEHELFLGQTSQPEFNKKGNNEIKLKDLNDHDLRLFKQAIMKEWKTNLENDAIRVIGPTEAHRIRQQQPHRIMQSRLLHVAKPVDDPSQIAPDQILQCSPKDVPCKAKSRWVARGDKDPDLFNVCSSSPVIHRDTMMLGLQLISSMKWIIHFADFSQAFMQGGDLTREQPLF